MRSSPSSPTRGLLLERAAARVERRLLELDKALEAGDRSGWEEYVRLAASLAALGQVTRPEHGGPLLTTEAMAARLGVSSRTILRRRKRGELTPAVQLGKRGRAALRWRGTEAG
jgi:predicted DNA-binding transcriptional regulator AlpA